MTTYTVFETPGLIDVRSFTVFGANSKPNTTNPIGFFGTGLKYAIAVLVREGIKVRLFIGDVEYEFYSKEIDFRGKTFADIKMRKRKGLLSKWKYESLPFTTELGKNWKLWQAFRELATNTWDEKGNICTWPGDVEKVMSVYGGPDKTIFVIEGEQFAEEYVRRGDHFLMESVGKPWDASGPRVEVIKRPSKYVYWRGMRVYDLPDEQHSLYTYNVLAPVELTEDRTVKYPHSVMDAIAAHVVSSEDMQLIQTAIKAPEKTLEKRLDYEYIGKVPSATFIAEAQEYKRTVTNFAGTSLGQYFARYDPAPRKPSNPFLSWEERAAEHIDNDNWESAVTVMSAHRKELSVILRQHIKDGKVLPFTGDIAF
jgi:hypothetical protein